MAKCKNCGANIPDYSKFCQKCGMAVVIEKKEVDRNSNIEKQKQVKQSPTEQSQEKAVANNNRPDNQPYAAKAIIIDFKWFNENFWPLYVAIGLVSYVLMQIAAQLLGAQTVLSSYVMGMFLDVLAIISVSAFLVIGVLRYSFSDKRNPQTGKRMTADTICLIVAIIAFVYIVISSVIVMAIGSELHELQGSF